MKLETMWEETINGKYRKWSKVCLPISFIFELTENTYTLTIVEGTDWDKKYIEKMVI